MAEYTLPNGRIIKGLSEGYTPEEIQIIAVDQGLATEEDFLRNKRTGADFATLAGEMGGGIGGAMMGGAIGSAILPGPGTFIGGLIGGAAGTFLGSMAGQQAEAGLEQRELQSGTMIREAAKSAAIDTAAGLGLGVAGKVIKSIAQPLMRLANPIQQASSEVDSLLNLQGKLNQYGTSLLPSQMGDMSAFGRATETYAASSKAFQPEYDRIVKGFDTYTTETTQQLLNRLSGAPREQIGQAFRALSEETEAAVKTFVDPLYDDIDLQGGIVLLTNDVKSRVGSYLARQTSGGVGRVSTKANQVAEMLNALPEQITPAMMAADITPILQRAETLAKGDAQATGVYNILRGYVEQARSNPALVDTGAAIASARGERLRRVSEEGVDRLGGAYGQAVDYVSGLRRKMSFSEAKEELSFLKRQLRDAESPTSPSSNAAAVYSRAVGQLERSMETAAKNFSPELYQKYRYVSDFYRKGQEDIYAPFMREALGNNEPAKVGELLARVGFVTPTRELDQLLNLAGGLGVKGGQQLRESVTRSYLEAVFKEGDAKALDQFNKDMMNPKFRDTFNVVVPKNMAGPIMELANEASILARHASGGAGASLGIASREIGAIENPGKLKSIAFGILPGVVKSRLSNKTITAKLEAMKRINEQLAAGKEPGAGLLAYVVRGLPTIGLRTGIATGAMMEK